MIKDNKIIIIVGFFHLGMKHLEKKVDKGYIIEIEPEKLWRQYNLRTANSIHKNFNEIKKLLNGKTNPEKIHFIFSKKFGIRNGFDCGGVNDLEQFIKRQKKGAKKRGYFYGNSNQIYNKIKNLLYI